MAKATSNASKKAVKKAASTAAKPKRPRGTMTATALARAFAVEQPFLGAMRASAIVLTCANTVAGNISRTIGSLGIDCANFTDCVTRGIRNAGCVPIPVPCSQDTTLIAVVAVIQHARKS
jgi:hypothetical protein